MSAFLILNLGLWMGIFLLLRVPLAAGGTTLGILIGLMTYLTAIIAARMPAPGLLYVVLAHLFGTLFYATTSQANMHWWQRSFSYLGMSESSTTYILFPSSPSRMTTVFAGTSTMSSESLKISSKSM